MISEELLRNVVTGLIYKATNLLNGKSYIGETTLTLGERRQAHERQSSQRSMYFHKALRKYGFQNFSWEVVDSVSASTAQELNDLLDQREQFFIKEHKTLYKENGYNIRLGGSRGRHSESTKRKISKANKGKRGLRGPDHYMYGKTHTEEARQKISSAKTGTKHTLETRKKMSESQTGLSKFWGQEAKDRKTIKFDIDLFITDYLAGKTLDELAHTRNVCRDTVINRLKKLVKEGRVQHRGNINPSAGERCHLSQSIRQINNEGEIVQTFPSIKEAQIQTGIKWIKNGVWKGGFFWQTIRPPRKVPQPFKCHAVSSYTKDGEYVATYASCLEAERINGIRHIAACANGQRKSAGGYLWKKETREENETSCQ